MNLPSENFHKRKNAYEAADSGIFIWRKNFIYFLIFFEVPLLMYAFLLRQLPGKYIYLSWLLLWWLKPFFDRIILHIVSVRFFEPNAGIKRLSKGLWQSLFSGLLGDLLWRRFSPYRAGILPIRILESQKNRKNISERKKLLEKGGLGYCFFLSIWGAALEIALLTGELIFIYMMSYFIGIELDLYDSEFIINAEKYVFALWFVNYFLIETMYICMGFGVYINSRIDAEGWNIENIIKNKKEKIKKKSVISIILITLTVFTIVPNFIFAEPFEIKDDKVPLEILNEIYESPDFGSEKDTWEIRLRNPPEEKKEEIVVKRYNNKKYLSVFEYLFASGLRILITVFIIAAVILLFFFARKFIKNLSSETVKKPTLAVLEITEQTNPKELLKKAINSKENLRLAWGYCTAAAILLLQENRGIIFPPNATENDCVKLASSKLGETDEIQRFRTIIFTWVKFIYAGIPPSNDSFNEAVSFCNSFINEAKNE